jgi:predicted dehydrogenase
VFRDLGADVFVWPVRERDDAMSGVHVLTDRSGPEACAGADLVVVATDTSRHVSDATLALDAGAQRLLVEKPVAPTAANALRLQRHEGASRVFVAAPLRAHRCFAKLRSGLERLGAPVAAHVYCQSWLPDWRPGRDYRESYSARADEGGVLRDLVHEIDYAVALFGAPLHLSASLLHSGPLEMTAEQAASLLWVTPAATVTMRLDYVTRPARRGITVTGPEGTLTWDVNAASVLWSDPDGAVEEQRLDEDLDRDQVMGRQARAALELDPTAPADVLLAAGAPATLEQGCQAVQICDDARESNLTS